MNPNIDPDHRTHFETIVGTSAKKLVLLATLMPPTDDPEDNWSLVIDLEYGKELKWTENYEVHKWLTGMSRSPGGRLFAVSIDGELHSSGAKGWTVRNLDCPIGGFMSVWAVDDDDVFIGGYNGERLRIRGNNVTRAKDDKERTVNRIHGSGPDDVYTVGTHGAIFHFDGKQWTEVDSPTNRHLEGVLCRSKNEIYVAGWFGTLYRSDGTEWEELECPGDLELAGLEWYKDALYVAASEDGVWRLTPTGLEQVTELLITSLHAVGGHLYGVSKTLVARYDGKTWVERHLEI